MNKEKISVIVPIYNVEKYLAECIDSIIGQTYKNIEIILVDDCSKDSSGKIADEYAIKDDRIKVIHKPNGGLSDARNAGMEIATGDYLMFVDSDDYLFPNSCEVLLNKIQKEDADYVIGNYINCDEDGTLWEKPVFNKDKYKTFKLDIKDYTDSFYIMNSSACNKIFRHEFIKKLDLKFKTVDITSSLELLQRTFLQVANEKNININLSIKEKLPEIYADIRRIEQIFSNLVSNALKFTPTDGSIDLNVKLVSFDEIDQSKLISPVVIPNGKYIKISVSDNGIGIKKEDIPKIFDKFSQIESSLKRNNGGVGLGLTITKQLIDSHLFIIQFIFFVIITNPIHMTIWSIALSYDIFLNGVNLDRIGS